MFGGPVNRASLMMAHAGMNNLHSGLMFSKSPEVKDEMEALEKAMGYIERRVNKMPKRDQEDRLSQYESMSEVSDFIVSFMPDTSRHLVLFYDTGIKQNDSVFYTYRGDISESIVAASNFIRSFHQ